MKWKLEKRWPDIHTNDGAGFIEAVCEHDVGHHRGIHGCDGCCADWPKEVEEATTKESKE